MDVKRIILDKISYLPSGFLFQLLTLNKKPELVFGKKFGERFTGLKTGILHENTEIELLSIVNNAINNVPYYSKNYHGKKITSVKEFKNTMSFIDKDIVVQNFEDFKSQIIDFNLYELQTTGGTSGKPLKIYQPKDRYVRELAAVYFSWTKVDYDFDVRAVMRNHNLEKGKAFQVNPITKEIQFNNFNNDEDYFKLIYKTIQKYKVRFFHAYPSAAYNFASYCKRNNLDISFLKAFLCSSENILAIHRELIEDEMKIKILGFYGHTEKLVFASNCKYSSLYHVDHTYGFFELIDDNGNEVKEKGKIGQIIGTTLSNNGMPLIRYKTGDYAEFFGEECPYCGEKTTVLSNIIGRWNGEKIYNKDGSSVTLTSLNLHGDIYCHIEGLQYFQTKKGRLEVRIIKSPTFTEYHKNQLYRDVSSKFKKDLELKIKFVDELQYQPNGKFLQLITQ